MKKSKLKYPYDVTDPDQLFDLICMRMWFCGNSDVKIPVDEARTVFNEIKRLLKK